MAIVMRRPREGDLDRLVEIENAAFSGDRLSRRALRHLMRSESAALILAGDGEQIAGYAVLLFRRGTTIARLYSIAVDPALIGRGIGARLLESTEAEARLREREVVRLEVRADNAAAIALYERVGYRAFGRRAAYYQDGEDALRMEKKLAEADR